MTFNCIYCKNECVNLRHGYFRCESCQDVIVFFQLEDFCLNNPTNIIKIIFAFEYCGNIIRAHMDTDAEDVDIYLNNNLFTRFPYLPNTSPASIKNKVSILLTFS
jgi:hypothetical protein